MYVGITVREITGRTLTKGRDALKAECGIHKFCLDLNISHYMLP